MSVRRVYLNDPPGSRTGTRKRETVTGGAGNGTPVRQALAIAVLTALPWAGWAGAGDTPKDTYFSLAVSENSHNHYGENLLFLDFQERLSDSQSHPRQVRAPRVDAGAIRLDGRLDDWKLDAFATVRGRVMNNYPLDEHFDATPGSILVGAAFDDDYLYMALRFEDANRDASTNRNRWVYRNGRWVTQAHARAVEGSLAAGAVNRDGVLEGAEDEDQLFVMFPMVDEQRNFVDGGLGCGGYCHANLALSPDPARSQVGDGVASMHTALPGDVADLWHWTATRSAPMNTLKDGYIDYGEQSYNGRKADDGTDPFEQNALQEPFRPRYLSRKAFEAGAYSRPGFSTGRLAPDDLLPLDEGMELAEGVSVPFYIPVPSTGGRADVETAARFDEETFTWTIELRRRLATNDPHDRQFLAGRDAAPPVAPVVLPGDPERGAELFAAKSCAACHRENGEGLFEEGRWIYPRNQRVSAPAIRKTVSPYRPERMRHLAFELDRYEESPPKSLMPFVRLSPQEAEDIAAWLQTRMTLWRGSP